MRKAIVYFVVILAGCATATPVEKLYNRLKERESAQEKGDYKTLTSIENELRTLSIQNKEPLVKALSSKDESTRVTAAAALGYTGDKTVLSNLITALYDTSKIVRKNALGSIGMLGFEDTPVEKITDCLGEPDVEIRSAALFALFKILPQKQDSDLTNKILVFLDDKNPDVRNHTLLVLGKIAKKEVMLPLCLEKCIKDSAPIIRENTALVLAFLKDNCANPYLIELLKDEEPSVVRASAFALSSINGKTFGRSYNKWREWYEEREKEKTLPAKEIPHKGEEKPKE